MSYLISAYGRHAKGKRGNPDRKFYITGKLDVAIASRNFLLREGYTALFETILDVTDIMLHLDGPVRIAELPSGERYSYNSDTGEVLGKCDKKHIRDGLGYQDKHVCLLQERCNCESTSCEGIHPMGHCTAALTDKPPRMLWLGTLCIDCADRITAHGGGQYITR